MVAIESNAAKVQIASSATDFILLVVSPRAADQLLKGKVKQGSDVITAAGPTGKTASVSTKAGILSYSHSKGLLDGISLEGALLNRTTLLTKTYMGAIRAPKTLFSARTCLFRRAPRTC
jgi:lipid-binding SYLF domain-containing protein